jgi:aminoglycoside phosphotransferase (APT) family kinase protein
VAHPLIELDVTEDLVRALLRAQHPDLADLPLVRVTTGWDNVLWRLGDDLALRLPVREVSAPLLAHEQEALPVLAPRLPVDVPAPLRAGLPGPEFPWPWSVVPWFDGVPAYAQPVAERTAWAEHLASVFVALHRPAPDDAPVNPVRGVPVLTRRGGLVERLGHVSLTAPPGDVLRRFDELSAGPGFGEAPVWLHGDPHPANVLVHDGRLRALIDWGDVTSGDPASDLATAWLTFDAAGRAVFRARIQSERPWDDATWRRAQAWAVHLSVVLAMHPDEYPHLAEIGRHGLAQALADD